MRVAEPRKIRVAEPRKCAWPRSVSTPCSLRRGARATRCASHPRAGAVQKSLDNLIALLDLEELEVNIFRGHCTEGWQRVFGGQVLAQALVAAGRMFSREGRLVISAV